MGRERLPTGYVSIAILSSSVVYLISLHNLGSSPKLVFSVDQVTFDKLQLGTTTEKRIYYRNNSKKTIEIVSVQASCGCTSAHASRTTLLPEAGGELCVSLKGRAGMKLGEVGTVNVKFSIDKEYTRTFPVVVNSLEGLVIVPEVLDFGYVDITSPPIVKKFFAVFKSRDSLPENPITCNSSSKWLSIGKGIYNADESETTFEVTIRPPTRSGTFVDFVTISARDSSNEIIVKGNLSVRVSVFD